MNILKVFKYLNIGVSHNGVFKYLNIRVSHNGVLLMEIYCIVNSIQFCHV